MRSSRLYLSDAYQCCLKIERYTRGLDYEDFIEDEKTYDAVMRALSILGEAIKKVPQSIKNKAKEIDWRKISGYRDVIVHGYFGLDDNITWDIIQNKIPHLEKALEKLINELADHD